MASLVADYGTSDSEANSSSNETSDSDNEHKSETERKEIKRKLPPPSFSEGNAVKNSVFVNPYVEAENNKMAVLEKHVKMVPQKTLMSEINGKKVCWMYRKGRCRFGHTCKFAHDSDIISAGGAMTSARGDVSPALSDAEPQPSDSTQQDQPGDDPTTSKPDRKRKKRPGLTQTLVPGKKVMKSFKNNSSSLLAP